MAKPEGSLKPEPLLTAPKVAVILGVSAETVRTWVKQGRITHITLPSGQPRFRRSDIDAILTPAEPSEAPA